MMGYYSWFLQESNTFHRCKSNISNILNAIDQYLSWKYWGQIFYYFIREFFLIEILIF